MRSALESIAIGVELGRQGRCVVPMFNTMHDARAEVVRTWHILRGLRGAVPVLPEKPSGPPVFLLDAERRGSPRRTVDAGDFDNRWYVFSSDFPSAKLLISHGVNRMLVLSHQVPLAQDLADALVGHGTLERNIVNPDDERVMPFPKPRAAVWRGLAKFGRAITRNLDGTFGVRISHG